jgi:hypothetical protein
VNSRSRRIWPIAVLALLPALSGCITRSLIDQESGWSTESVSEVHRAEQLDETVYLEFRLADSWRSASAPAPAEQRRIELDQRAEPADCPLRRWDGELPEQKSAPRSLPVRTVPDNATLAAVEHRFTTSGHTAAVYFSDRDLFLLRKRAGARKPELIACRNVARGRHQAFWGPFIRIPALPFTLALDIITGPLQLLLHASMSGVH